MALDRTMSEGTPNDLANRDGVEPTYREANTGRSNFTAFVLGGGILAAGVLGFLYYDMATPSRLDPLTTGSIARPASDPKPIHVPEAGAPRGP